MKAWSFLLVLALAASPAWAQRGRDGRGVPPPGKSQGMTKDERQRMRQDMRDVYKNPGQGGRQGQRQMSPQEREQLRRDIQDANRQMKR